MKKLWLNVLNLIDNKPIYVLLILLFIQLFFRLIIFFSTNTFAFTDWRVYLAGIEQIKDGYNLPLFSRAFTFLLSYIGYFFKYVLGNLDYFFIFNCLLGVLTSLVSYLIVKEITVNNRKAIFVVLLQTIYVEFLAFSSIFYTVIIMLLLVNLVIYLTFKIIQEDKYSKIILYSLITLLIFILTFFFKFELKFFGYLLLIFAIINFKNKKLMLSFTLLGVLFITLSFFYNNYKKQFVKPGRIDFIMFGHTYYGGFGGEGAFIFKDKEEIFFKRLNEYFKINNIKNPTIEDTVNFQKKEIIDFVKSQPHMWLLLQARKFFYTFGVVPEGNSFTILYKGLFNRNFIVTSSIVVFPIILFVFLFIFAIKKDSFKFIFQDKRLLFLSLLFLYYIAATVFYGHYQERYRIPVLTLFVLPLIAIFSENLTLKNIIKDKKSFIIKLIIIFIFISVWTYEAYEALVLMKDKYGIIFNKDF